MVDWKSLSARIAFPGSRSVVRGARFFLRDYGMLFVLMALIVLFSVLTWTHQHPSGADAGRQVASLILSLQSTDARVVIVARDTADDRAFADEIATRLTSAGAVVLQQVNGEPTDARRAIRETLDAGNIPTALAVNDVTGRWSIYQQFPEVRDVLSFQPQPYHWPNFLKMSNVLGVANQTAVYAVIAIGMTMVILTAGIDLSVGSLVALSSVVGALWLREMCGGKEATVLGTVTGVAMALLVCTIAGCFTGLMITTFRLPPFIVTLAMMLIANGLAFRLSAGLSIPDLPRSYFWLGGGTTFGIPNPVLLMVLLYPIAHVVMSRTTFGRYVYAIGGNEEAARLSGVAVKRVLVFVYMMSGCLAGLGGVILTSTLQAGDPKFGLMYELEVIAAVVVGGTSLMGGRGKVMGTLIGAFIIAVIKNGMNLTNVDPFNQKIVLGAVLLTAVLLDTLSRGTKRAK